MYVKILICLLLFEFTSLNSQKNSNGRHRTIWSEEEKTENFEKLNLESNKDSSINQNTSLNLKKKSFDIKNSIEPKNKLNFDENLSTDLTPEPLLAAKIVKVDFSNSKMLLIPSSPTYLFTNQTEQELTSQSSVKKKSNENINFVRTTEWRMLNLNKVQKNCLSTLDCDLELNERCLITEQEETVYFDDLIKYQPFTTIYSQYLKKFWKNMKNNRNQNTNKINLENLKNSKCGCAAPAFARNIHTGQCELLRLVEIFFNVRTEQVDANNDLKLEVLNQIDYVIKNSESLQDIVHHFRLISLTPYNDKNEDISLLKPQKKIKSKLSKKQSQFTARGLLLLFSSEYTVNFNLLFTNEYCLTQNTLRMRAQQKMLYQVLASANQTWPPFVNTIKSSDFWFSLNNTEENIENQSKEKTNNDTASTESTKSTIFEIPFIHHRLKKEIKKRQVKRSGIDVQLDKVNGDQINICNLNTKYSLEQIEELRKKLDLDDNKNLSFVNNQNLHEKKKILKNHSRFFQLTYCDNSRSFCEPLPHSRAGYVCTCHGNLMDLSPFAVELPGEYCGVRCPLDYCTSGGYCHVANSLGEPVDHDLATQQHYLSATGKITSIGGSPKTKNLNKQPSLEFETFDYKSILDAYKKNRTILQQRYYAAIFSVQQRFSNLFKNIQASNLLLEESYDSSRFNFNEDFKFGYGFAYSRSPQLATFYCTCPKWRIGSRCQYSGFIILMILTFVIIILAVVCVSAISILCTPGRFGKNKKKFLSKNSSTKKKLFESSDVSSKDSLDVETLSHYSNDIDLETESKTVYFNKRKKSIDSNKQFNQPAFKIIEPTPQHSSRKKSFDQNKINNSYFDKQPSIISNLTYKTNVENHERRLELFNEKKNQDYCEIYNETNNQGFQNLYNLKNKREISTQTPIHIHNIYASAGELRIETDENFEEPKFIDNQKNTYQSNNSSLAYLSAINLKQIQLENQKTEKPSKQTANQLPHYNSGQVIAWF